MPFGLPNFVSRTTPQQPIPLATHSTHGQDAGTAGDPEAQNSQNRSRFTKKNMAYLALGALGMAGGGAGAAVHFTRRTQVDLQGAVRTASGLPIEGAECRIGSLGPSVTDAQGEFHLQGRMRSKDRDLQCSHPDPNLHGGLGQKDRVRVDSHEGRDYQLLMFSKDPTWDICKTPVKLNATAAGQAGEEHYRKITGDPQAFAQQVQSEVCQGLFRTPDEFRQPFRGYTVHLNPDMPPDTLGQTYMRSSEMELNPGWINGLGTDPKSLDHSRKEVAGTMAHEFLHNYQGNTYTARSFSNETHKGVVEAQARSFERHVTSDSFPKGAKCDKPWTQPYDAGGKVYAYIQQQVPELWPKMFEKRFPGGDVSQHNERIREITGKSMDQWEAECREKGLA